MLVEFTVNILMDIKDLPKDTNLDDLALEFRSIEVLKFDGTTFPVHLDAENKYYETMNTIEVEE